MRVYRYLDETELALFEMGEMDKIGTTYPRRCEQNTHRYQPGVKSLHFFRDLDDLNYIRRINNQPNTHYYICQFSIDPITLIRHSGTGYYEASGYDIDVNKVREYAIPVSEIEPDDLKFYIKDQDRNITSKEAYSRFESKKCSMPTPKFEEEPVEEVEEDKVEYEPEPDLKTKIESFTKIDDVCF